MYSDYNDIWFTLIPICTVDGKNPLNDNLQQGSVLRLRLAHHPSTNKLPCLRHYSEAENFLHNMQYIVIKNMSPPKYSTKPTTDRRIYILVLST